MKTKTEFTITKRSLTVEEVNLLVEKIKRTPCILGYSKEEWKSFGGIFVATVEGKLCGVAVVTKAGKNFSELAVLYVVEEYRKRGIGMALVEEAVRFIHKGKSKFYTVSANDSVIKILKKNKNLSYTKNIFQVPCGIIWYKCKALFSFYRIKELIRKSIFLQRIPAYTHFFQEDK